MPVNNYSRNLEGFRQGQHSDIDYNDEYWRYHQQRAGQRPKSPQDGYNYNVDEGYGQVNEGYQQVKYPVKAQNIGFTSDFNDHYQYGELNMAEYEGNEERMFR